MNLFKFIMMKKFQLLKSKVEMEIVNLYNGYCIIDFITKNPKFNLYLKIAKLSP